MTQPKKAAILKAMDEAIENVVCEVNENLCPYSKNESGCLKCQPFNKQIAPLRKARAYLNKNWPTDARPECISGECLTAREESP